MPLPPDCSLSLLGYSRPGDTVHSKPKQAIIIRLSTEILDALESNPDAIKVDFNDNPVFWAGSTKFSMNAAKENLHHELYLRATSAAKKNAPLKLHANVVGKFQVERKLDNDVRSRLRHSTKTLQEQRQERGIIQLESPPAHVASKLLKKVGTSKLKTSLLPRDHAQGSARDTAPRQIKKGLPSSIRRRMIQLLAVGDRTADETVKSLGGPDCTPAYRLELLDVLEQVAEPCLSETNLNRKSSTTYRLKLHTWTEVRPTTWDWSDEHRPMVSARFEHALQRSGIPESDPVWRHSLPQATRTTSSMSASANAKPPNRVVGGGSKAESLTLRAVASVKEKRGKTARADSGNEGVFKDEPTKKEKMVTVQRGTKGHEATSLPPAPKASAPLRKPPGSGFKSGRLSSQAATLATTEDSGPPRDVGGKSRDFTSSSRAQPMIASANRPRDTKGLTPGIIRSDMEPDHFRSTNKRMQETLGRDDEGITQKRRVSARDTDVNIDGGSAHEPVLKKRKVDRNVVDVSGTSPNENGPRGQNPKKMRKKLESSGRHSLKDDSVAVSQLSARATSPGNSSLPGNPSSSQDLNIKPSVGNRRRRSPIYTSSDDDSQSTHANKDFMSQQLLPTDHASLRRRYNKSYGEYLTAFHKLVTFRDKIDGILGSRDGNNVGFTSESDADLELMDPDELGRLCLRHKKLRDELESIQQVFSQSNGGVLT